MFIGVDGRARLLRSAIAVLALAGVCCPAYAEEPVTELDAITVVGPANAGAGEALVTQADREELQRKMIENLSDLDRLDASVSFGSGKKSINIRGLDDNRVLTTIDGIRLPWLTDPRGSAEGGLDSFDFDAISNVDIMRGADSTRYGSGVLGGVVALHTLDPEELIKEGRNWGAILKGGYDSSDRSWRSNAAWATRANDTYLLIQGGFLQGHETGNHGAIGGHGAGRTLPNPLDYQQASLLAKLHQHLEGGHRFRFTGEVFNREENLEDWIGTYSSPARGGAATQLYEEGSLHGGDIVRRERFSAAYDFISPDGENLLDEAHVTAYWLRQRLNNMTDGIRIRDGRADIPHFIGGIMRFDDPYHYGFPSGEYSRDNQLEQTSYGIFGDGLKAHELGGLSQTFRFGSELYIQDTHQYSAGADNCPDVDWTSIPQPLGPQSCRFLHTNASDMPDVESLVFGIFAENELQLPGDFTLTPGIRFDWYDHKPAFTAAFERNPDYSGLPEGNSGANVSAKLRGAWQATGNLELYGQWAQAFRAPRGLELYQNFGAPGSYARIGNPDLKPETSNGFEIGAAYDNGELALSASLFSNYYRNFIDMVQLEPPGGEYPIAGVTGYANRSKVHLYGAELRGHWEFAPDWRAWGSIAWTEGRDTDLDEYINSIPPLRALLGLGYTAGQWGADLSITLAAARDKVSAGGFAAPAHGVVDVMAWWEPQRLDGLRLQAGIFNLFDRKYWNAPDVPEDINPDIRDFYSEPGRNFRLTITRRF